MLKAAQLLLVFLVFFLPAVDTDLGWHLRYGEHFFKTGNFLRENTLTYFLADYRWTNPFPLYQPLTYSIYKAGGLLGLAVAYGLLGTLGFWIFSKINSNLQKTNLILYLFLYLFSLTVFGLGWRAQFFTFLGLIIVFFTLRRAEKSRKWLFAFPILFLIWANLHGGFVLGLTVLGLAIIPMCQPNPLRERKRIYTSGFLGVSTLASAAAALINPFGIEIYKEALRHAQYPLHTLIAEWVAPNMEIQMLIAVLAAITLLFIITSPRLQSPEATADGGQDNINKLFWVLVLVLFAVLALQARRNSPFFGLVVALAFLEIFQQKLVALEQNTKFARLWPALLGSGVIVLLLFQAPKTIAVASDWQSYCNAREIKQPCQAVEYVRANPSDGKNVFVAYEWGGFLEWQLPQYKFFVDGRMPAWVTPSPYTSYLEIIQARPGWEEKLDNYGTDWLLIGNGTYLDLELQKNKSASWEEKYRDSVAVIYTKQ